MAPPIFTLMSRRSSGNRWWIFDATRLCPRNGLVRIGTGRDAVDVAFATIFGSAQFIGMKLAIEPVDGEILDPRKLALSTAEPEDMPATPVERSFATPDLRAAA